MSAAAPTPAAATIIAQATVSGRPVYTPAVLRLIAGLVAERDAPRRAGNGSAIGGGSMNRLHVPPRTVALGLAGTGLLFIFGGLGRSDQLVAVGLVFGGLAALFDWLYSGPRPPDMVADPGLRLTPVGRRVIIGVTLVLAVAAAWGVCCAPWGGW